jgi:4'-phosphopantetheinyl transferase
MKTSSSATADILLRVLLHVKCAKAPVPDNSGGGAVNLVGLWLVLLTDRNAGTECALSCLSAAERARAIRFQSEDDRRRFILSHAALRCILSSQTGISASELEFDTVANGKPVLCGCPERIEFNLAHSGGLAVIAACRTSAVGVDVELVSHIPDSERIARQFFSPAECRLLQEASETEKDAAFLRTWTRKEALLKAVGSGLVDELSSVCTVGGGDQISIPAIRSGLRFAIRDFEFGAYIGAVAVRGDAVSVAQALWKWEDLRSALKPE